VALLIKAGHDGAWSPFADWFDRTALEFSVLSGAFHAFCVAFVITLSIAWVRCRRTHERLNWSAIGHAYNEALSYGVAGAVIVAFVPVGAAHTSELVFQTLSVFDPGSTVFSAAAAWGAAGPLLAILLAPFGRYLHDRLVRWSTTPPGL